MPVLLVVLAILQGAPSSRPGASALPSVCVITTDRGDAADRRGRLESVKDLREALAKKEKDLVVVDDEARADIVIEVADRTLTIPKVVIGLPVMPGQPGGAVAGPSHAVHLRVTLRRGDGDPMPFTNKSTVLDSGGGWKAAAEDVAKQIDKWIVEHR